MEKGDKLIEKKNLVKEEEKDKPRGRTKPEVYSRIVGYLRPISQWNVGKLQELKDRKMFKVGKEVIEKLKKEVKDKDDI